MGNSRSRAAARRAHPVKSCFPTYACRNSCHVSCSPVVQTSENHQSTKSRSLSMPVVVNLVRGARVLRMSSTSSCAPQPLRELAQAAGRGAGVGATYGAKARDADGAEVDEEVLQLHRRGGRSVGADTGAWDRSARAPTHLAPRDPVHAGGVVLVEEEDYALALDALHRLARHLSGHVAVPELNLPQVCARPRRTGPAGRGRWERQAHRHRQARPRAWLRDTGPTHPRGGTSAPAGSTCC